MTASMTTTSIMFVRVILPPRLRIIRSTDCGCRDSRLTAASPRRCPTIRARSESGWVDESNWANTVNTVCQGVRWGTDYVLSFFTISKETSMNHKRIAEISTQMLGLVNEQRAFLNDTSEALTRPMTQEEIIGYAERNERLRNLWLELNKLG
jgi:hypothetical protein